MEDITIGQILEVLVEFVRYRKGYKNSKGESAPWVIVQHGTGKVLSAHKSKAEAKKHLRQMEYYKHQ
jgi:GH15 family glucan-1,4-alpha-glucosidase